MMDLGLKPTEYLKYGKCANWRDFAAKNTPDSTPLHRFDIDFSHGGGRSRSAVGYLSRTYKNANDALLL